VKAVEYGTGYQALAFMGSFMDMRCSLEMKNVCWSDIIWQCYGVDDRKASKSIHEPDHLSSTEGV